MAVKDNKFNLYLKTEGGNNTEITVDTSMNDHMNISIQL